MWLWLLPVGVSGMWQVTGDKWQVIYDMWRVAHETWHKICDKLIRQKNLLLYLNKKFQICWYWCYFTYTGRIQCLPCAGQIKNQNNNPNHWTIALLVMFLFLWLHKINIYLFKQNGTTYDILLLHIGGGGGWDILLDQFPGLSLDRGPGKLEN